MAYLATKPHLIALLNLMLTARKTQGEEAFTEGEIIEILSAMAETDALATNPPINPPMHWQNAPSRII
jgi:hypothetical protein